MSRQSRREFLRLAGLGAGALMLPRGSRAQGPTRRPNVIFVLGDDVGYLDTTLYGSRYYETPNIERLARRGMMFTNAYAANPLCSPTRASIMTGKYPARLGLTAPAGHLPPLPDVPLLGERAAAWQKVVAPRSRRFLPPEEYTLGEAFRDAGYATGFIGKWHLGLRPEHWPEQQGFQLSFHGAPDPGPPSYFSPYRFRAGTVTDGPAGEYITDRVTDEALRFLEGHRDEPFFLCLWHYAVHAPFQGKEELIAHYREKVDPRGQQDCPTMGAMIQSLDEGIGRLLDQLDRLGLAENTILVFFSDNGGNMYSSVDGTTPTNNAPLRGGKATIYEGGTREPCIVIWPGVVEPGSRSSALISSVDFYPTLLDMTGIDPRPAQRFDGESIVPVLRGTGGLRRDTIFCHFPHYTPATGNLPATYVRQGDWKLIRFYDEGPQRDGPYELYNLAEDPSEAQNLARGMPDKVAALDALISQHLRDIDAIVPKANPNYNPRAFNPMFDEPPAGWIPSVNCSLAIRDGHLNVTSFNEDPNFHTTALPDVRGPIRVRLRMRCATKGIGQVFWTGGSAKRFHRSNSVTFPIEHDGEWHEYTVELPLDGKLRSLRLDPGTGPGEIEIDWVRVESREGTTLKAWEFDG